PAVAFALSTTDAQIYTNHLDFSTGSSGPWALTAPGQFSFVEAGTYGTALDPMAFGIGVNRSVYAARVHSDGSLANGWFRLPPGEFQSLVADTCGTARAPIVFGIGTQAAAGQQVYVVRFDPTGSVAVGWELVAPGAFVGKLALAKFGNGDVGVFGISING